MLRPRPEKVQIHPSNGSLGLLEKAARVADDATSLIIDLLYRASAKGLLVLALHAV